MKSNQNIVTVGTYTYTFTGVADAMAEHFNAACTLQDALTEAWNASAHRTVPTFRKAFTTFALGLGYGDTWIKRTLASNDELRMRATSKTMAATKAAKKPNGVNPLTAAGLLADIKRCGMAKAEILKLAAALAKLA